MKGVIFISHQTTHLSLWKQHNCWKIGWCTFTKSYTLCSKQIKRMEQIIIWRVFQTRPLLFKNMTDLNAVFLSFQMWSWYGTLSMVLCSHGRLWTKSLKNKVHCLVTHGVEEQAVYVVFQASFVLAFIIL